MVASKNEKSNPSCSLALKSNLCNLLFNLHHMKCGMFLYSRDLVIFCNILTVINWAIPELKRRSHISNYRNSGCIFLLMITWQKWSQSPQVCWFSSCSHMSRIIFLLGLNSFLILRMRNVMRKGKCIHEGKAKEWCSLFSFLAVKYLISQYDIHSKLPEFRLQLKYLKLGHRVGTVQLLWPYVWVYIFFALYVLQKVRNKYLDQL